MKRWRTWVAVTVLVTGAAGGLWIALRRVANRGFAQAGTWRRALAEIHGAAKADALIDEVQQRYREVYRTRPHHDHPALRAHLAQHILPGVALYQVLRDEKGDQAAALAEVDMLLQADANDSGLRKAVTALRYLPVPFALMRMLARAAMRFGYPASGWDTEWIEDSNQRIAFNIHRCFYLDTLTTYGVPELTPSFCRLDDLVYQALPASIRWERTGTLARGQTVCDFCYRHVGRTDDAATPGH